MGLEYGTGLLIFFNFSQAGINLLPPSQDNRDQFHKKRFFVHTKFGSQRAKSTCRAFWEVHSAWDKNIRVCSSWNVSQAIQQLSCRRWEIKINRRNRRKQEKKIGEKNPPYQISFTTIGMTKVYFFISSISQELEESGYSSQKGFNIFDINLF